VGSLPTKHSVGHAHSLPVPKRLEQRLELSGGFGDVVDSRRALHWGGDERGESRKIKKIKRKKEIKNKKKNKNKKN